MVKIVNIAESKQRDLFGNNITTNVTTNVTTWELELPENGWKILSFFATQNQSFSVNELARILKGKIHINTIRDMISRLKEKAWVKLHWRNTGKTHRENRWIVTTDGLIAWNKYYER